MNGVDQVSIADVGDHYVNGRQSHVPDDVLEALDVDPGDELVYRVENGRVTVERRTST